MSKRDIAIIAVSTIVCYLIFAPLIFWGNYLRWYEQQYDFWTTVFPWIFVKSEFSWAIIYVIDKLVIQLGEIVIVSAHVAYMYYLVKFQRHWWKFMAMSGVVAVFLPIRLLMDGDLNYLAWSIMWWSMLNIIPAAIIGARLYIRKRKGEVEEATLGASVGCSRIGCSKIGGRKIK